MRPWGAAPPGLPIPPTTGRRIRPMTLPRAYIPGFAALADACLQLAGRPDRRVVLYPHVQADGDALGSSLGLALLLERLDIAVDIVTGEEVPDKLGFLPTASRILVHDGSDAAPGAAVVERQALAIGIDCPAGERLGARRQLYEAAPQKAIIDHHISDLAPAPLVIVNSRAAAVCEIITWFLFYLECRLGLDLSDIDIATCLMAGLMTDTGRFSFSNTSSRTFSAAALLLRQPVATQQLASRLFDAVTPAKLRFIGETAQGAELRHDGRFILSTLEADVMTAVGGVETDLEGLVALLRDVEGVDLAVLLREMPNGDVRGNVRSSELVDAQSFARAFGGGGHLRAAGFTVHGRPLGLLQEEIFALADLVFAQLDAARTGGPATGPEP
ncbi:MAG: DHH family phosphoesterase [Bacillota bacterium]|nr:DHH family phosphoesterase [Bacillota bacterium]